MAKKFQFIKANVGEVLSINGGTLTKTLKIHAFKEVDTENYVYGWEGDVAGNFHFFNKTSFNLTPKKSINGLMSFTATITDSVYTAEKLTATAYANNAATGEFQWDTIKAEDITDVPTDIDLKSGKSKTETDSGSGSGTANDNPKTASAALASLPTWSWFLIVPAIGVLGWMAVKALVGKGKKKKVVSK
ncbi:hypothetical protein [Arcicella rosea]|uniref:Uncharacterized protein n=1 Tax=Arcicella rosea TaxID=502909 RepID=A0A841EWM1_9BACT|nr:hypothetical protein [Arcicella rosea]MBB6003861.1 hypothetical protein [Arcicella rosea]